MMWCPLRPAVSVRALPPGAFRFILKAKHPVSSDSSFTSLLQFIAFQVTPPFLGSYVLLTRKLGSWQLVLVVALGRH